MKIDKIRNCSILVVTLNAFTSTIAYADENTDSTFPLSTINCFDIYSSRFKWSFNPVMQPESGFSTR